MMWEGVVLVLVLSVCVVENSGSFNLSEPEPEFGAAPNTTRVQVESTAFLHCPVYNLGEQQVLKTLLGICPGGRTFHDSSSFN